MPDTVPPAPRQRVEAACARLGTQEVVSRCVHILLEGVIDDDFVRDVVGSPAHSVLAGHAGGRCGYWPRVWATRALLYVWDESATDAIIRSAADESWRVREMAAKVVRRHRIHGAFTAVTGLCNDQVPRVRAAAERAVIVLMTSQDGGVGSQADGMTRQ